MSDISRLLEIIDRLVDGGNSVIVIEHNLDVIRSAVGSSQGGSKGGEVVFEACRRIWWRGAR
jgi:excinuclease UvrABC ATPase subunit